MNVKYKRITHGVSVSFKELSIGQVYEDRDGILCIKTKNTGYESNCICFIDEEWDSSYETFTEKVFPLTATLEING